MRTIYKIGFAVSILLTVAAIVVTIAFPLKLGVDFRGGSVMELNFVKDRPVLPELNQLITSVDSTGEVSSTPVGDKGVIVRLNSISEPIHQEILQKVSGKYGQVTESRFDSIGPTVGKELKNKSVTAMILLLLAIVVYISFVFRKLARTLSPWAMGLAAVAALIHDVAIPVGVFALLGHFSGVEISAVFVASALTILGFSVSDTVVIFDRVRENVLRFGSKESFPKLVHDSIMQTLVRSLNTTFATLLTLFAIYFFGGESIRYFTLSLIIGIFLGAYSSIFIAAPMLVWFSRRSNKGRSKS